MYIITRQKIEIFLFDFNPMCLKVTSIQGNVSQNSQANLKGNNKALQ